MTTLTSTATTPDEPQPPNPPPTGRARWSRLAVAGALVAAGAPTLTVAAAVAWGLDVSEDLAFFGVTIAVAVGAALLLRTASSVARVVGIVLALATVMFQWWAALGLASPDSVFDFVPGVAVVLGIPTALVAGVAAIRAQRRGDVVPRSERAERVLLVGLLGLLAVGAIGSGVGTVAARETVGDPSASSATIGQTDFEFDQDAYDVAAGDVLLVRNDDPFLHTFTIDALGIDVDLGPGSEKLITIPADAHGDYVLYCTPHTSDADEPTDDDMAAILHVG